MKLIQTMPRDEMPDEKLLKFGARALTDAELLAIIIRTGTIRMNSVDIARKILQLGDNGLSGLMTLSRRGLMELDGIGEKKAIQLVAIGEISKRIARQTAHKRVKLSSPESVADYFMEELRYASEEQVWGAAFDSKFQLIAARMLTSGIANTSLITPRELFNFAVEERAVSVILIHNHPSGDPSPSNSDIDLTLQMEKAGSIMGISLADHIVIGDNSFFSMKEHGYIN